MSIEDNLNDWLLRREAGEDWHPQGLQKKLLGAIAVREDLLDEIVESSSSDESLLEQYTSQIKIVQDLKEELGVGDPPPLPLKGN